MSRDEAIACLTDYYKQYLHRPGKSWDEREFRKRSYSRWLALELISKWRNMPEDKSPMLVLWDYYDFYDKRMLFSDSLMIIELCEMMQEICGEFSDVLNFKIRRKLNGKKSV